MTNGQIIRDIVLLLLAIIGMVLIAIGVLGQNEWVWRGGIGIIVIYSSALITRLVDKAGA